MSFFAPVVVRLTFSHAQADEWRLWLISQNIESRIEPTDEGFAIVIDEATGQLARAAAILNEHDDEQVERRAAAASDAGPSALEHQSHLGWIAAITFALLHALSLRDREWVIDHGAADAAKLRAGEWWRAVTALFIHGDYMHVFSNSVAAIVLFTALGRWIGSARAAILIVISGAMGNLVNAYAHVAGFSSIGASTATFSAIGLLAALQFSRRDRRVSKWWPVAAALGLFAMLGTSKETDVLAHLFGLGAGLVVGLVYALTSAARLRRLKMPAR